MGRSGPHIKLDHVRPTTAHLGLPIFVFIDLISVLESEFEQVYEIEGRQSGFTSEPIQKKKVYIPPWKRNHWT